MSKHFLCCIPVRFGVFIISLSTLLGWGITAAALIYSLVWIQQHESDSNVTVNGQTYNLNIHINTGEKIGWGAAGAIYVIFTIIALFGLIGAIRRNHKFVKAYSRLMWFLWIVNLLITITLIALFAVARSRGKFDDAAARCADANKFDSQSQKSCEDVLNQLNKTSFLIGWSVGLAIELLWHAYGCIIISRYVTQLEEEQAYLSYTSNTANAFNGGRAKSFYPHEAVGGGESEMLTKGGGYEGGNYPYADPHHSFGGKQGV